MPCAPLLRFIDCHPADVRAEAGEVMSGVLEVVRGSNLTPATTNRVSGYSTKNVPSSNAAQRVFIRVYRTSSEHFAVLYPVRAIMTACRPLASLNLKSCTVKSLSDSEFRISPRACEGLSVTLAASTGGFAGEAQMSDWLRAFTDAPVLGQRRKKVSDHRLPLPVLEESDEDVIA